MDDRTNPEPVLHLLVGETDAEEPSPAYDGGRGFPTKSEVKAAVKSVLRPVEVPVSAIRFQMDGLLKAVDQIFAQVDRRGGLVLDEVELTVDINAKGQVRILGSGAEVGSTGAIKLKFKRSPQNAG